MVILVMGSEPKGFFFFLTIYFFTWYLSFDMYNLKFEFIRIHLKTRTKKVLNHFKLQSTEIIGYQMKREN